MGLSEALLLRRGGDGWDVRPVPLGADLRALAADAAPALALEITDSDFARLVGVSPDAEFELVLGLPYEGEAGLSGDPAAWCRAAATSFDAERLDAAFALGTPFAEEHVSVAFEALGLPTEVLGLGDVRPDPQSWVTAVDLEYVREPRFERLPAGVDVGEAARAFRDRLRAEDWAEHVSVHVVDDVSEETLRERLRAHHTHRFHAVIVTDPRVGDEPIVRRCANLVEHERITGELMEDFGRRALHHVGITSVAAASEQELEERISETIARGQAGG